MTRFRAPCKRRFQNELQLGPAAKVHFRFLLWLLAAITAINAFSRVDPPSAVTTFESAGLYWRPAGGADNISCSVQYRKAGASVWKKALNLWYDPRSSATLPGFPRTASEYRGSIVGLTPATNYEIKLTLSNGPTQTISVRTWDENTPIGSAVYLPELSDSALTIHHSGTAAGYIVYKTHTGKAAVIDVQNRRTACVYVNGSYIVLRCLTLKNGKNHGIELGPAAHHVVIEQCEITGWGEILGDGWGKEHDAAVYGRSSANAAIVVQRCRIHHPRSDANSWSEPRPKYPPAANGHPQGPQAIELANSLGNNVFRYNEIHSDLDHMFNDGIGGYTNAGYHGFPGPNSDVYGNIVTHCWDNPLEMEGGGMNVRVWGNYTDWSYTGIAVIPAAVGPAYIFRNVCNKLLKDTTFERSTRFVKAGAAAGPPYYGDGRVYVFHNTMLQEFYKGQLQGGGCGISNTGIVTNYVSRNNIWYLFSPAGLSVKDEKNTAVAGIKANSFDYDLYNGGIASHDPDKEAHGIHAAPVWASDTFNMYTPLKTGTLRICLAPGTAGEDAGERLDNFNDDFAGKEPDIGANENGITMEFGAGAYENPVTQTIPSAEFGNPCGDATGRFFIRLSGLCNPCDMGIPSERPSKFTFTIFDLSGRTAYYQHFAAPPFAGGATVIDCSNLKRGVYVVRVAAREGTAVKKIIR